MDRFCKTWVIGHLQSNDKKEAHPPGMSSVRRLLGNRNEHLTGNQSVSHKVITQK